MGVGKQKISLLKVISLLLVLLVTVFTAGCQQPDVKNSKDKAPETIKIGGILSFTGPDSNIGSQVQAGYELAIEEINKKGGVYVKQFDKKIPLEIKTLDMESSAEKAIARAETLYSKENVVAYVGTTFIAAASGIAEKNKVPTLIVASASQNTHERGYKYWFSVTGKTPDIAKSTFELLDSIPQDQRPKNLAVFEEQSDFGIEQSRYFQEEARKRGYQVAVIEKYSMMNKDFSPLILAARNAGAEVVFSSPIMPDGMSIVRQMKELDYNPKVIFLERAADDISWIKAMGEMGNYAITVPSWHPALDYPGVKELNEKHQAKLEQPAGVFAGPGYATIQILADAIERAGTLDREKVREALLATDLMTVQGPVKFRDNGTNITPPSAVCQWQNGKNELIWFGGKAKNQLAYPIPPWHSR